MISKLPDFHYVYNNVEGGVESNQSEHEIDRIFGDDMTCLNA